MKRFFLVLSLTLFLYPVKSYSYFNIVDRLASPFINYDDSSGYNSEEISEKVYASKTAKVIGWIIILGIIMVAPPRRRWYSYYDSSYDSSFFHKERSSLGATLFDILTTFLKSKSEKSFMEFTDKEAEEKEEECKKIFERLKIDIKEIKEIVRYSFEQYIRMLSGEENDLSRISTAHLYKKYLKEIVDLHSRQIKTAIEDFKIDDIKIVNIRYTTNEKAFSALIKYTSKQYYMDIINREFISGDRTPLTRYIFLTFIEDNGFKLSLIEQANESYVMKLENTVELEEMSNFENEIKPPITSTELSQPKLQLLIADFFFKLYTWWQNPDTALDLNIDEELVKKLKSERIKISNDRTTIFEINKIQITSMEFLSFRKTPLNITKGVIVRIKFILKGRFAKNSIFLIDNEEQHLDEMFDFEIVENKIKLKEIIKRINDFKPQDLSPLQIEWYV